MIYSAAPIAVKYKRALMTIYVFDKMLDSGITIDEIKNNLETSKSTAYEIINDIQSFICDFYRYDLELVKINGRYYLKK